MEAGTIFYSAIPWKPKRPFPRNPSSFPRFIRASASSQSQVPIILHIYFLSPCVVEIELSTQFFIFHFFFLGQKERLQRTEAESRLGGRLGNEQRRRRSELAHLCWRCVAVGCAL